MAQKAYFVSVECMEDDRVSSTAKLIFAILATCCDKSADKDGYHLSLWRSHAALQARAGLRDARTVKRCIAELTSIGAISQVEGGYRVYPFPVRQETPVSEPSTPQGHGDRKPHAWEGITSPRDLVKAVFKYGISHDAAVDGMVLLANKIPQELLDAIVVLVRNCQSVHNVYLKDRWWTGDELITTTKTMPDSNVNIVLNRYGRDGK